MKAFADLFRRRRGSSLSSGAESGVRPAGWEGLPENWAEALVEACRAGRFHDADELLRSRRLGPDSPGEYIQINRALATVLSHAHVKGEEWGHTETHRWETVRRFKAAGASVESALVLMAGPLRLLAPPRWNALVAWGALPSDARSSWKMWAAWVADPILGDPPPDGRGEARFTPEEAQGAVRNMLAHGLCVLVVDEEGRSPLHVLCATARVRGVPGRDKAFNDWVSLLTAAGASPAALDHDGNSVLHAACEGACAPFVPEATLARFLAAHPSLPLARNRFGQQALDVLRAAHRQHRKAGAQDAWERRIAWLQAHTEHAGLADTLPEAGARPSRRF